MLNYRTFSNMASTIRKKVAVIDFDFDLVVGIPRSGIPPAYMIALFKNVGACSLDEFLNGSKISHGTTRKINNKKIKRVLVVDDSIFNGHSIKDTQKRINEKKLNKKFQIKYLAVFGRQETANIVDYCLEIVKPPRIFQWNYLNSNIVNKACFDIDGVLCVDPTKEENDDGPRYLSFIKNAKPLYLPNIQIHSIVTSRLEKYRKETEDWLKKNNVKYNCLYMLNLSSKEERIKLNCHSTFKADIYDSLDDACLFVESNPTQAEQIAKLTGKPCICVANDVLYENPKINIVDFNLFNPKKLPRNKRILLYSHELTYTGAPHSLLRICKILLKAGYYVEVWSPIKGDFSKEFERAGAVVKIVPYNCLNNKVVTKYVKRFDLALVNTIIAHRAYMSFISLIDTIWYIREAYNIPAICKHNPDREEALVNAQKIYCVSEYAKEFISKKYNSNVEVLHNCVEDYGPCTYKKNKKISFLVLGTISLRKGYDVLIKTFTSLPKKYSDKFQLRFAGQKLKTEQELFDHVIGECKKNKNISYLGEIKNLDEKKSIYKSSDVVIVPSRDESCSLVALEGASFAKPLIVTNNVGAKYIVDENSGRIVDTGNVASLKKAVCEMIDNPDLVKTMGKHSRLLYQKYASMPVYEKNIMEMINNNIKKRKLISKCINSIKQNGIPITCAKITSKLKGKKKTARTACYIGSKDTLSIVKRMSELKLKNELSGILIENIFSEEKLSYDKILRLFNLKNDQLSFDQKILMSDAAKIIPNLIKEKQDFIIIDLLDEKFSIFEINKNNQKLLLTGNYYLQKIIARSAVKSKKQLSEKALEKNIEKFVFLIKKYYINKHVVFIRNKYANFYYKESKKVPFENLKIIENNNKKINLIYKIMRKKMKRMKIIDVRKHCIVKENECVSPSPTAFCSKYKQNLFYKLHNYILYTK